MFVSATSDRLEETNSAQSTERKQHTAPILSVESGVYFYKSQTETARGHREESFLQFLGKGKTKTFFDTK